MGEGEGGFFNLAEFRWQACMACLGWTSTKDSEQQRAIKYQQAGTEIDYAALSRSVKSEACIVVKPEGDSAQPARRVTFAERRTRLTGKSPVAPEVAPGVAPGDSEDHTEDAEVEPQGAELDAAFLAFGAGEGDEPAGYAL